MSERFAAGHCLCEAVSTKINAEPVLMAQCHCKDCQRASGTGHMSIAFFKADQVEITGETKGFSNTTDSGNTATRHFCPNCGSRVFSENTGRPGLVGIPVGSLDEHDWFRPQAVVYTRKRAPWDATSTDIPNFEGMPPFPR